jgi:hypothetical protein
MKTPRRPLSNPEYDGAIRMIVPPRVFPADELAAEALAESRDGTEAPLVGEPPAAADNRITLPDGRQVAMVIDDADGLGSTPDKP